MNDEIGYTRVEAPFGYVCIAATPKGVCYVQPSGNERAFARMLLDRYDRKVVRDDKFLTKEKKEMKDYFDGKLRKFSSKFDILEGTEFHREVWKELIKIPYGKVVSYKDLAERVGRPTAFRAVGQANGRNPISILIPCHRVINHNGGLGGYGGGLRIKEELLRMEGVEIVDGKARKG